MTDRRLQVFHTVGRMLSFTKAAEVLQMTQPAVTFQIRQLEEQFNVRLFDRSHNRIDLTEAGKRAYEYAERIFGLYGEMENSIRQVTGSVSGLLRIGASTTIAQYVLPGLLAQFQEKFPEVRFQLKVASSQGVLSLIENSFVDAGMIESTVAHKKLVTRPYADEELMLVVPKKHELAMQTSVTPMQAYQQKWIMREDGSATRSQTLDFFTCHGMDPNGIEVTMELGCPEAIKRAVEVGRGVTLLPKVAVEKELRLDTLAVVALEPGLSRTVSFIYKEQKFPLGIVEELVNFATSHRPVITSVQGEVLEQVIGQA